MAANVDTSRVLDDLEAVLGAGLDEGRCSEALEILRRWQWDRDLNESSRRRATDLLKLFSSRVGAFGAPGLVADPAISRRGSVGASPSR